MLRHAEEIAARLIERQRLGSQSLVVEVASNDGYLLQFYQRRGIPVLGVEPARNIAKVAEEKHGIRTITEFFSCELAQTLRSRGERADVIHANNVFAHVPDLNGVTEGFRILLKDTGVASVEVPYVKDLIDHSEFDTIYHEHLCYFSLTTLDRLAARHGLVVKDVERIPMHGGSLRVFFAPASHATKSGAVEALLAEEAAWGVDDPAFYRGFATRVAKLRDSLRDLLLRLKSDGKRIAAYGAAAKGVTLLTYLGVGADIIDFVADRSTVKQGYYMPGVRVPIVPPSMLLERKPDYVLLLTWNFAEEILRQQTEYMRLGGHFIVPIPEVSIR